MPRTVTPHVNFRGDIAFLSRLSQAIEKDKDMTPEEKQKSIHALSQLMHVLQGAEIRRMEAKFPIEQAGAIPEE